MTLDRVRRNWLVAVFFNVALAIGSIFVWFAYPEFREHVLFVIITMPSEFLVTFVQHEPIILYFAKDHNVWSVVVLSLLGTVAMEIVNYSSAATFAHYRWMRGILAHSSIKKARDAFNKAPFTVIVIAALTPIPFFPFRFLAPFAGFSLGRYILALTVGRAPRFYLLALLGEFLNLRNDIIIGIFVLFLIIAVVEAWRSRGDDLDPESIVLESDTPVGDPPVRS